MADLIEDPKKKKASFGDAAAAATDGGVTQLNVGKPGDFPVNPDGTPMQKTAPTPGLGAVAPAAPTERPPANSTATLAAPSAPAQPQSEYGRQMGELGSFFGALPVAAAKWITSAPGGGGPLAGDASAAPPAAPAQSPVLTGTRMNEITDPRSLLNPSRQDQPMNPAAGAVPAVDTAQTPAAVAPIAAGAVKTQGQMNMEADLKSAEAMKAERLAAESRAPQAVVTHSGNDWQARNNLRNLEVSASSITAKPKDLMAYEIARKHDTQLQGGNTTADVANVAAANRNAEINSIAQVANARTAQQGQQFGASHDIAKQRLALDNRKADIADTGAQMDNATKKQLQDLNAQILKETDPAKLAVLQEKAQTLTGKYQRQDPAARDVYGAIAGGTDAMGNKTDPIIYNKQTGERAGAQQQALPPGLVVGAPTKQASGTYQVGSKSVTIKDGKVTEIK